jgi:hypothetical protein
MIIGIAGRYSADTEEARNENLRILNKVAAQLMEVGHIPLIGVNAALPVVEFISEKTRYEELMKISLAVISCCDALLFISESPGANREKELMIQLGKPVYYTIDEILQLND